MRLFTPDWKTWPSASGKQHGRQGNLWTCRSCLRVAMRSEFHNQCKGRPGSVGKCPGAQWRLWQRLQNSHVNRDKLLQIWNLRQSTADSLFVSGASQASESRLVSAGRGKTRHLPGVKTEAGSKKNEASNPGPSCRFPAPRLSDGRSWALLASVFWRIFAKAWLTGSGLLEWGKRNLHPDVAGVAGTLGSEAAAAELLDSFRRGKNAYLGSLDWSAAYDHLSPAANKLFLRGLGWPPDMSSCSRRLGATDGGSATTDTWPRSRLRLQMRRQKDALSHR